MSGINAIIGKFKNEKTALLDILREVQMEKGCVSDQSISEIASGLNISAVDVEGVVSFYHFFTKNPVGKYAVYLNNNPVSYMFGRKEIAASFENETGCKFGSTSKDGNIGLYDTSCIGMNDQEPSAIINGHIFTSLTSAKVKEIASMMKSGKSISDMVKKYGDGANSSDNIKSMVSNNIRNSGKVIFTDFESGAGLKKAVSLSPEEVITEIKQSNLRGRGGAGFPTGMKWDFCRKAKGEKHYIVCNADEGEPGTFKDRVLLTEYPQLVFEGMAIGGYSFGAEEGIIYVRAEYRYLNAHLESVLADMRKKNILGKNAGGKQGFNFDIKIKFGAGAYICGEESALIESAEGKRGEPRNRPPFPVQNGYMGQPTSVNNVETLASIPKILTNGSDWFKKIGTTQSAGTKIISVSGDCDLPGVYEVDFGTTIKQILEMTKAKNITAVQVGGPSGQCISEADFNKNICFDQLATGGSMILFNKDRNLLEIAHNFMEFFVEESCGWCVPCRVGNVIIKNKLEKIMSGKASNADLTEIEEWSKIVKSMSRCGLGQTSPNPVVSTLKNFRGLYESKIKSGNDFVSEFDLSRSVKEYCEVSGRKPTIEE